MINLMRLSRTTGPEPIAVPDLAAADVILLNTSGGKDSQVMMDEAWRLAAIAGVTHKLLAVHCDLGVVEWADTAGLSERQAGHYGIEFCTVTRILGNLLDQIAERRITLDRQADELEVNGDYETARMKREASAFPNSSFRFCTSDQKTSQVKKLFTELAEQYGAAGKLGPPVGYVKSGPNKGAPKYRAIRIINVLGMRAQESDHRSKMTPLGRDESTNGVKDITRWLPIHHWTEDEVWARIKETGVEHHRAYDLGMSRLSCAFCVFASKNDLVISAKENRALAEEYAALEEVTRSRFTDRLSITELLIEVDADLAADLAA